MGEPKSIVIESYLKSNGIEIIYIKSRKMLRIFGWHGSVGLMDSYEISLKDFMERLGIK
jgi:hypothetical protein